MSYARLQYITCDDGYTTCHVGYKDVSHRIAIEIMYNNIVHALQQAEMLTVPHVPVSSLKPFWNKHLDSLNDSSIFWGNPWNEAGRPRFSELHKVKTACCLKYMIAIKQALTDYEHKFDDELHDHFIRKEPTEFWKCWTKNFAIQFLQINHCVLMVFEITIT
jgi:hypothetical protein